MTSKTAVQSPTAAPRTLLSPAEVSEWLSVPSETLRDWRKRGRGPDWQRVGPRHVRYSEAGVLAWLEVSA